MLSVSLFRYLAQTVSCSIPAMSVVSSASTAKQPEAFTFATNLSLMTSPEISIIWFCTAGLKYEALLGQPSRWSFRAVSPQSARIRSSALKFPSFSAETALKSRGPLSLWPRRARPCRAQKRTVSTTGCNFLLFSLI